jgi:hypothetical protein
LFRCGPGLNRFGFSSVGKGGWFGKLVAWGGARQSDAAMLARELADG